MALAGGFKHSELATIAGTAARPNEDYAAAGPDWAVVLDGATHFDGVDTGCVHDVPWLVGHLAAALTEQLILGAANLPEVLASAIEVTCSVHADTCDLANPDSPSSTVALVRSAGTAIEYLVLGDSPVILRTSDRITPVVDDWVDHLRPGGRPYTRALVRSKRNSPGGFWVASTDPYAAHEAISGTVDDFTHAALLTDGVTRLVEHYGYSWADILKLLDKDGPPDLSGACGKLSASLLRPHTGTASSTMTQPLCISR
jgi:hypothetical protein